MHPKNVNPRNFQVEHIIYNDNDFAIAYGRWEGESDRLGMRWNGNGDNDAGYPKTFGNPVWFMLPEALTASITNGLLGNVNANISSLLDVLQKELVKPVENDNEVTH